VFAFAQCMCTAVSSVQCIKATKQGIWCLLLCLGDPNILVKAGCRPSH
jgi:hypothetical protein